MRIDAHQHYWCIGRNGHEWPMPDLAAIHRDFVPPDLDREREALGIARTVLVQSQPNDADTDWLCDLAAHTSSIGAVVGWVDMKAPGAAGRIGELAGRRKLRGLRPMLQNLPADWILDPAAGPALAAMEAHGLVLDALIRPEHIGAIRQVATIYPGLNIVVDHAAKPHIADGLREPWAAEIAALAEMPQLLCKISGLPTEARLSWKDDDLRFYVEHLIACFGPERLLWGSDWPVLLLAGDYRGWFDCVDRLTARLTAAERAAIFGGNAARIYRIAI